MTNIERRPSIDGLPKPIIDTYTSVLMTEQMPINRESGVEDGDYQLINPNPGLYDLQFVKPYGQQLKRYTLGNGPQRSTVSQEATTYEPQPTVDVYEKQKIKSPPVAISDWAVIQEPQPEVSTQPAIGGVDFFSEEGHEILQRIYATNDQQQTEPLVVEAPIEYVQAALPLVDPIVVPEMEQLELVYDLPSDAEITPDERQELIHTFAEENIPVNGVTFGQKIKDRWSALQNNFKERKREAVMAGLGLFCAGMLVMCRDDINPGIRVSVEPVVPPTTTPTSTPVNIETATPIATEIPPTAVTTPSAESVVTNITVTQENPAVSNAQTKVNAVIVGAQEALVKARERMSQIKIPSVDLSPTVTTIKQKISVIGTNLSAVQVDSPVNIPKIVDTIQSANEARNNIDPDFLQKQINAGFETAQNLADSARETAGTIYQHYQDSQQRAQVKGNEEKIQNKVVFLPLISRAGETVSDQAHNQSAEVPPVAVERLRTDWIAGMFHDHLYNVDVPLNGNPEDIKREDSSINKMEYGAEPFAVDLPTVIQQETDEPPKPFRFNGERDSSGLELYGIIGSKEDPLKIGGKTAHWVQNVYSDALANSVPGDTFDMERANELLTEHLLQRVNGVAPEIDSVTDKDLPLDGQLFLRVNRTRGYEDMVNRDEFIQLGIIIPAEHTAASEDPADSSYKSSK